MSIGEFTRKGLKGKILPGEIQKLNGLFPKIRAITWWFLLELINNKGKNSSLELKEEGKILKGIRCCKFTVFHIKFGYKKVEF